MTGCTGVPVAITSPGHSLMGWGYSNQDLSGFSFSVSDERLSCSGNYNLALAFSPNFSFPISCSDGRAGNVEAVRGALAVDKAGQDFPVSGRVVFSDGAVGMFNLGAYAQKMNENSIAYKEFIEEEKIKRSVRR